MQIIYSVLRKLIVMNSVSQFQALQLLTPFFRLERETLLIVLKILCKHLKDIIQYSVKCFFFFYLSMPPSINVVTSIQVSEVFFSPPHSPFKMYFYSKCLCLCKCISHVYSEMLISYLRSGIQLYLNYMPDGWAMHTFQFFDNLMNISLGKMRLSEHPKSSVTVVS